jgi:hypothetical protein
MVTVLLEFNSYLESQTVPGRLGRLPGWADLFLRAGKTFHVTVSSVVKLLSRSLEMVLRK